MAKKRREYYDPREKLLASLNLKNLKRACIVRSIPFRDITILDFLQLQSWVYKNFSNPTDPTLLEEFDNWYEKELLDEGIIEDKLHVDLKFGYYSYDEAGNRKDKKRNSLIVGMVKSDKEKAQFKPRKGSRKELAFSLFSQGLKTSEVIEGVWEVYPDVAEGSIKVWGSQYRKRQKLINKIDHGQEVS